MQLFDVALFVAYELLRHNEERARIVAKARRGFFLSVVDLVYVGPLRPGIVIGALFWRARHNLELRQRLAAVSQ